MATKKISRIKKKQLGGPIVPQGIPSPRPASSFIEPPTEQPFAKSSFVAKTGGKKPALLKKENGGISNSPQNQDTKAFDQEKIIIKTRTNPYTKKVEKYAAGYDADINDIRKAKAVKAISDDITGEAFGTRSGVSSGGVAEKAGYSGRAGGAITLGKGIYESKYNVGNEEGNYASKLEGTDIAIAEYILKENEMASKLLRDRNPNVELEYDQSGLKLNDGKTKEKSKTTTTVPKSKKVAYAKSLLKLKAGGSRSNMRSIRRRSK